MRPRLRHLPVTAVRLSPECAESAFCRACAKKNFPVEIRGGVYAPRKAPTNRPRCFQCKCIRYLYVYIGYPIYMIRISYKQLIELVFAKHIEDRVILAKGLLRDEEE